jgi:hypothetical protein
MIEQGTLSTANRASYDRLTGKAVFFEDGVSHGVDFGLIDMTAAEYGIEREKIMAAIQGNVVQAFEETVSVSPIYTLKGKQFHAQIMPLVLLGTRNADVAQAQANGATTVIANVTLGGTYDIGARNISAVVVTQAADTLEADVDYFLDAAAGFIRFAFVPSSKLSGGESVTVTFNKPAITRESHTAFNKLNRDGVLKLLEFDNKSSVVKNEWAFPGSLSAENPGDTDPTKSKQWSFRFSLNGQPTLLRRAA